MRKRDVMLRIDQEDAEALDKWAARQGISVSAFVREVMHDWLRVNPPWPEDTSTEEGARFARWNGAMGVRTERPWVLPA